MTNFKSEETTISHDQKTVFDFLSDFNNFKQLMPEQVSDWHSSESECSFRIQNMATIEMKMGNHVEFKKIEYLSFGDSPLSFSMQFHLTPTDKTGITAQVILEADLNPMLKMMASRPLQNFVNVLSSKLPEVFKK